MLHQKLETITRELLKSANLGEEIAAAQALAAFFAENSPFPALPKDDSGEIFLDGGVALSSGHAAFCIAESIRTTRLIKGVYQAIMELQQRFPGEQIRILYAGCGPYGTLLLPLLPLFKAEELECTLLEINPLSVECIQKWLAQEDFKRFNSHVIETDAICYNSPEPFHLLISETMFNALLREPQLRIVANLAPQLHEKGLMVPEEIRVELFYTAFGQEPFFDNLKDRSDGKNSVAEFGEKLFSLTKDRNFSEQVAAGDFRFVSPAFSFPEQLSGIKPDICIFTHIRAFGEISIGLEESSLTNPHCVGNYFNLGGRNFQLVHTFETIPDWKLETL